MSMRKLRDYLQDQPQAVEAEPVQTGVLLGDEDQDPWEADGTPIRCDGGTSRGRLPRLATDGPGMANYITMALDAARAAGEAGDRRGYEDIMRVVRRLLRARMADLYTKFEDAVLADDAQKAWELECAFLGLFHKKTC